ncbi:MAG: hypothetical protein LKF42_09070 [Streptococcaceae bacterium]|nr:hypothetical protein [Streptococcaceae bacterium]
MGGRGSSSASSRSFSTGDKGADKIISDALKKYSGVKSDTNLLRERLAKKVLSDSNGNPLSFFKEQARILVERNNRNLRDIANFKKDIAHREKQIKKEEQLLKSYSKETRLTTSVRGEKITTNSKRYETQAKKVSMLNRSLLNAHREYGAKQKSVKNFSENFKKEIDSRAKKAMIAEDYKRRKKR